MRKRGKLDLGGFGKREISRPSFRASAEATVLLPVLRIKNSDGIHLLRALIDPTSSRRAARKDRDTRALKLKHGRRFVTATRPLARKERATRAPFVIATSAISQANISGSSVRNASLE